MSNLQTLNSQKLPRGVEGISIDEIGRTIDITLKPPTYSRIYQFSKLFQRGKPFNLGIVLTTPELSSVKAYVYSIFPRSIVLKY